MSFSTTDKTGDAQAANKSLIIRQLGLQPYEPVWQRMQAFTKSRDRYTRDEIWLLEHEQVFTQGKAGKAEHVLEPGDIPVVPVDRGGQVTYHGPGQLVGYLLIDLKRRKLGVRALVEKIEESIIELLNDYGVEAQTRANAPGVYVEGGKIASLGLRVTRGRCFHGLALNLDMDLEPFLHINPCGYQGLQVTQLKDLVGSVPLVDVGARLADHLVAKLGYDTVVTQQGWDKKA
ncbi:MAG: lipoyl(octanoyl) transferase LipB [Geopsychrobacter sp.]|nr:lipoyl(octanoyl) transferase LipB [Geopsychrobacter sp.]